MPESSKKIAELLKADRQKKEVGEPMSMLQYLELCKADKMAYATPAERLLAAIGEPEVIDTKTDPKLSRIFGGKAIARYDAFKDFKGMEEVIMQVVNYLKKSAQGLEERKQVLYLLGPVGTAKSTLAQKLVDLMQDQPIYTLRSKATGELSPIAESPLGLVEKGGDFAKWVSEEYGVHRSRLKYIASPWAEKRLKEVRDHRAELKEKLAQAEAKLTEAQTGSDQDLINKATSKVASLKEAVAKEEEVLEFDAAFEVVKVYPSRADNRAIARLEAQDKNTQDSSALLGKRNTNAMEELETNDPDGYAYFGGLCQGNRGIMEFVEMFKADISILNPVLSATQDGQFNGLDGISAMPFEGIILAHSNETEWKSFYTNKKNEALLDRICVIKVPYSLRVDDEVRIYEKYIKEDSEIPDVPLAPKTLETLAKFAVLTRLEEPKDGSSLASKMRAYNGDVVKDVDPTAKKIEVYRSEASPREGMDGLSARQAFKTLSEAFNSAVGKEPSATPLTVMKVLKEKYASSHADVPDDVKEKYGAFIADVLEKEYFEFLDKEIMSAYLDNAEGFAQNLFERYFYFADAWLEENDYVDQDTGARYDRAELDNWLKALERPSGIGNEADFRNSVVKFMLRNKQGDGSLPSWRSFAPMQRVIEKKISASVGDMVPILSSSAKLNKEDEEKRNKYVSKMKERGYTEDMVSQLSEWYTRKKKALGASA